VVDEYGVIYGRAKRKTRAPRPYNEIFDDMALCAREAAKASGIPFEDIESVGIGCPGALDLENGMIDFSNNLDFYNVPIREYMENALGKRIYLENDANAAAWGEFLCGSGRNTDSMVMITLGTGVGSGIIENGRLIRGAYGTGSELGHMAIRAGGEKCNCGRSGCLEAYASATALIRDTKRAMEKNPDSKMWNCGGLDKVDGKVAFDYLETDVYAREVVESYIDSLACTLTNFANIFTFFGNSLSKHFLDISVTVVYAKELHVSEHVDKSNELVLGCVGRFLSSCLNHCILLIVVTTDLNSCITFCIKQSTCERFFCGITYQMNERIPVFQE
jgi:glucokinase